jgi:hypothetical protein
MPKKKTTDPALEPAAIPAEGPGPDDTGAIDAPATRPEDEEEFAELLDSIANAAGNGPQPEADDGPPPMSLDDFERGESGYADAPPPDEASTNEAAVSAPAAKPIRPARKKKAAEDAEPESPDSGDVPGAHAEDPGADNESTEEERYMAAPHRDGTAINMVK